MSQVVKITGAAILPYADTLIEVCAGSSLRSFQHLALVAMA
jgi:hypothetical protein